MWYVVVDDGIYQVVNDIYLFDEDQVLYQHASEEGCIDWLKSHLRLIREQ